MTISEDFTGLVCGSKTYTNTYFVLTIKLYSHKYWFLLQYDEI